MWPKCCVSIVHRGTTTFHTYKSFQRSSIFRTSYAYRHGLRTPREEIAYTARPKINSHSQFFCYGGSIFCLPHRPNFSGIFDLCLHWVSVVRDLYKYLGISEKFQKSWIIHPFLEKWICIWTNLKRNNNIWINLSNNDNKMSKNKNYFLLQIANLDTKFVSRDLILWKLITCT